MANEQNFLGEPETLWLKDPKKPDRKMVLLKDFGYRDWKGKEWLAPHASEIDGASIPRALWTLVGSPYTGDYRRASIVHDIACIGADWGKRRAADKMFYQACRDGGCSVVEAMILHVGVRIGAWIGFGMVAAWSPPSLEALGTSAVGPRLSRTRDEEQVERDFKTIAEAVIRQGETDDVDEIERRVDAAGIAVTGAAKLAVRV